MSTQHWWQDQLNPTEKVLWQGQPTQQLIPPKFAVFYGISLACLLAVCLASPWIVDNPTDFWTLAAAGLSIAAFLWIDQRTRAQRVYVVTSHSVWEFNRIMKSKDLPIDRFLQFHQTQYDISFDRHPFFSLNHLSNPDAAFQALKQAQEASQ